MDLWVLKRFNFASLLNQSRNSNASRTCKWVWRGVKCVKNSCKSMHFCLISFILNSVYFWIFSKSAKQN